jgi:hypothetical protein
LPRVPPPLPPKSAAVDGKVSAQAVMFIALTRSLTLLADYSCSYLLHQPQDGAAFGSGFER